jgi:hypothetical protein
MAGNLGVVDVAVAAIGPVKVLAPLAAADTRAEQADSTPVRASTVRRGLTA